MRSIVVAALIATTTLSVSCRTLDEVAPAEPQWISLFNGEDLTGWTPKIAGEALGEDRSNTFRVVDGAIEVSYDEYDAFEQRFGHLFYEHEYSHYRMRMEYRFHGEQSSGGPGWAYRNSGIMVHGQSPESMAVDDSFPVSIEVQLLGGNGTDPRTTGNLCTPGTHVEMDGELVTRHCIDSVSQTYHGDGWVTCEIEVRGHEVIRHWINGALVMTYHAPQLDPGDGKAKPLIEAAGGDVRLSGGSISLQAESHPCSFRNIELMPLE